MAEIKLIVGLGNPGKDYENSRHNLGFRAVEEFAKQYKLRFKRSLVFRSLIAQGRVGKENFLLCLPLTFMNNSGSAVKKIFLKKKIEPKNLLVVLDDINLPFSGLRIRPGGSDGGHNGLKSILESLASAQVSRLRLGIGCLAKKDKTRDYVLGEFNPQEKKALLPLVKMAQGCILTWLKEGITGAMNKFN